MEHRFGIVKNKKILFDLFEQEKVKLYLCGHEHTLYNEYIGNNSIMQITSGCMESTTSDSQIDVGFCVGNLETDGKVEFSFHSWNNGSKAWAELDKRVEDVFLIQPKKKDNKKNNQEIFKFDYPSSEKRSTSLL